MKQEKDYFLLTLDETEEIAKEVIRLAKIVKTMHLANPDNPDIIEKASELQGKAEKLTLRARVLVMYSQAPDGKALSFKNTENVIPVELAISEDGWFCMKDIASLPENSPAIESFNLFAQASETVRTGIITGLGARLQILQTPAVRRMISTSDIDLTLPGREKCAYFIVLSESNKSMAFLSSLFFSCLFIKLMDYADSNANGKCAVPVNMILDEFNNIGKLGGAEDGSDFAAILSTCRSRELRVMMAIQSLGQLKNRYPNELWSEIVGNCDIQLMLGCTDKLTADYFSERSGDMTVDLNNVMTNRRTLAVAQIIPEYRQMDGVGRRKVMLPDEILRLPQNELLCVVRGCNVLRLEKVDYTRHPFADKIIKTSVRDYKPKLPEIPVEIPIEKPKEEEPSIGVKRAKPVRIDGTKI